MNTPEPRSSVSQLERQVTTSLTSRADRAPSPVVSLDDVRGRARQITRRRRAAAAGAVAAVLAVGVPLGLSLGPQERAVEPPPASVVPEPVAEPVLLDPDAPVGAEPAVGWVDASGFVQLRDGSTLRVSEDYRGVWFVAGHVLALTEGDPAQVHDLGADGSVTQAYDVVNGVVVADDESAAAWVGPDGRPQVFTGDRPRPVPAQAGGLLTEVEPGGAAVWVAGFGENGGASRIAADGTTTRPLPQVVGVNDVHQAGEAVLATATLSVDDIEGGSCGGLFSDARPVWETCEHTVEAISPDGSWVQVTQPWLSGQGQGYAAVLDAETGDLQVTFDAGDRGSVTQVVWEDEEHLLLVHTLYEEQSWRVFRVGVDGSVELALAARPGNDVSPVTLSQ